MKLPPEILSQINIEASRHKNPERLDWNFAAGKYTAVEDGQTYVVMYSEKLGCVIGITHKTKLGAEI